MSFHEESLRHVNSQCKKILHCHVSEDYIAMTGSNVEWITKSDKGTLDVRGHLSWLRMKFYKTINEQKKKDVRIVFFPFSSNAIAYSNSSENLVFWLQSFQNHFFHTEKEGLYGLKQADAEIFGFLHSLFLFPFLNYLIMQAIFSKKFILDFWNQDLESDSGWIR